MLARDKVLQAFRHAGVSVDDPAEPTERADWQAPTEIPPSAEGEQIFEPLKGATAAPAEILPFETFDASQWEGVPIEPRRWIAHNRIPVGEPGIMSGDGGTGKTKLALQLGASVSAELPDWVGGLVETHGPVIVCSAEEKLKEMHRRTLDVVEHRGLSFKDLRGRLHFICDHDNTVLGAPDRNGVVQPTMSLLRLEKTVASIRPALVIVENAADVYSGNESDRPNVTRFVRSLLGRLTVPCESTVMLIQHPSVSGLNDGTGRSGSTGWNNSGRWRCNFTKIKDDDSGLRQFEVVKNNYGPDGEKVRLRWDRGVFVPEGQGSTLQRAAAEAEIDNLYLTLLDAVTAQRRPVSPSTSSTYAPSVFEVMPAAGGCKSRAFAAAQERLFARGAIVLEHVGPPSKRRTYIVRAAEVGVAS
jgi:RecA-family ATPase